MTILLLFQGAILTTIVARRFSANSGKSRHNKYKCFKRKYFVSSRRGFKNFSGHKPFTS